MNLTEMKTIFVIFVLIHLSSSLPERGKWDNIPLPKGTQYLAFTKNMYADTVISVSIDCKSKTDPAKITVGWMLRYSPCAAEYQAMEVSEKKAEVLQNYFGNPTRQLYPDFHYDKIEYKKVPIIQEICGGIQIYLPPQLTMNVTIADVINPTEAPATTASPDKADKGENKPDPDAADPRAVDTGDKPVKPTSTGNRKKRQDKPKTTSTKAPAQTSPVTTKGTDPGKIATLKPEDSKTKKPADIDTTPKPDSPMNPDIKDSHELVKTWKSGYYVFILMIEHTGTEDIDLTVNVEMKNEDVGYISAVERPLLIFYGVMGIMYIFYGLIWLVMMGCNWRDLLRVQYWVGGLIVLGMLEKAVFYGEYQSIANTGESITRGATIFAEVVSCMKRALARMLVIVVSLGFGIVKPRLGQTFHKVLFVGGLYFVLATIEGSMRSLKPKGDASSEVMLSAVPLAVVDASICWWIFSSLVQTTRQLRLRRNIVKLTLYRHFTNTLIFAVLASIIFMIWSIVQIKMKVCLQDWGELWIDEAFWHLLFSVLLLVIMILWRPSSNNQRYAFSPLLDTGDSDEEDEPVMNDAFDGMKMRTKQANGSPKQKQTSIEDDLKWVEENIPSAISDKAQTLLDSDEEVLNTKYEMSKMQ